MNNVNIAFFLTFTAGISTMIGLFPLAFKYRDVYKIICSSLAFASGVMLSISIFDLVPEAYKMLYKYNYYFVIIFIFILFGIYLSYFIDKVINSNNNSSLYNVGIISMIGIILHNIPEGIVTFITTTKDIKLGLSLAFAIAMHNIPEGISIGVPIYYSSNSKIKAIGYTFIASVSELVGAIITYLFLSNFINNTILGLLFSLITGIMIQISIFELLPTSFGYNNKYLTIFFFTFGFIFMIINLLF